MLVSGSVPVRNYQDVVSQKITTLATREVAGYSSAFVGKKKQRARIKFKKIKISDKIIAPDGMMDDYAIDEETILKTSLLGNIRHFLNISNNRKNSGNFFLSGLSDDSPPILKYFNNTYIITELESPVPREGAGTEAVQGLVEKSLLDDETNGRVIIYHKQIAPEDTSSMFFYKLGFRYVEEEQNFIVQDAIDKNMSEMIIKPAYMYLPKDNIPKLLRYGHLF